MSLTPITTCLATVGRCEQHPLRHLYRRLCIRQVKETIPPLAEAGITQLYPSDPSAGAFSRVILMIASTHPHTDRRPALLSVLRSLLVTYSYLTSALLAPPLTNSSRENVEPEWKRHVDWISILSQNILAAANDLRPVQVHHLHISSDTSYLGL